MRSRRAGSAAVVTAMSPPVLLSRTCADVGGGPAGRNPTAAVGSGSQRGGGWLYCAANVTPLTPEDSMLISTAYAQAAGGAPSNDFIVSLMPLVLIFVVFYFLMIRPQQQKVKQHRDMVENLKRGDQVVTGGGRPGQVPQVEGGGQTVNVRVAPNRHGPGARAPLTHGMGEAATHQHPAAPARGAP